MMKDGNPITNNLDLSILNVLFLLSETFTLLNPSIAPIPPKNKMVIKVMYT
ncbi:hypothetical protein D3C77_698010 [compost metagenome]